MDKVSINENKINTDTFVKKTKIVECLLQNPDKR